MKAIGRIGVLGALAFILLAGCYLSLDDGAGSVGIQLPEPRNVEGTDPAPYARIYVINGSTLLPVGEDTAYAEVELGVDDEQPGEYSVGPVPAGDGYRVVLVLGDYADGADGTEVFVPEEYALSGRFMVYAGQATSTEMLSPEATPFSPVDGTLGLDLQGIVFANGMFYTTTSTTLYSAPAAATPLAFSSEATLPAGETANSITLGALLNPTRAVPWVNTSEGILPYDGTAWDEEFDALFDAGDGSGGSVLDSGAFVIAGGPFPYADNDLYGYLQFDGGLSGVWDNGGTKQWLDPIDLEALVAGQPIYDLAVRSEPPFVYGYFATKLGAFRMPQEILTNESIDTAQEIFQNSSFLEVSIDGTNATITNIAVGTSGIYLGTPRGVVFVDNPQIGSPGETVELSGTLVPDTAGRIVEDIVMMGNYIAILTNHFLVSSDDGGDTFALTPLYASSAGEVSGMFLDGSNGAVLLSGSQGIVKIDINSP